MLKAIFAAATIILASCTPPPEVPPPRFRPNPPYPPEIVDQPTDRGYYERTPPPSDRGYYERTPPPTDRGYYERTPTPPAPTRPGEYPTARRTANPKEVISPYEPYNVIDIEGFSSGQLARDPSNNQIFRVP